jgi:hypothetical protein
MAAVAITPASGSITAVKTVTRVTCSAVASNTATGYSTANYPASPQVTYYFKASKSGSNDLKGPVLSTSAAQIAEWDNLIFPSAGTWTVGIYKTSDDSSVATASVVVA